jgi:outer membrane protein OmpA-like peptidoglycan-associated protein
MAMQRVFAVAFALALPLVCSAAAAADPTVGDILSALTPQVDALGVAISNTRSISPAAPNTADMATGHHKFMVAPGLGVAARPSIALSVEFRSGSADLTPAATTTLSKLGMALNSRKLAGYRFRIEGHTDTVGTKDGNQRLSQARADKVADFLEHDFGVLRERLVPVGVGEEGLAVLSADQKDEPHNRRVLVVNIGS